MKKTIFLIVCIFSTLLLHSQAISLKKKGTTRAVVVGISEYQDKDIPDLSFGHRDAEYFVSFLKSKAGGELPDENIQFLSNETATMAQIAAAMDWLMDESKEGDIAYIYFSGHGDVETKSKRQLGFFLTHDSPSTTYIAGAYPLFYLQVLLETLADNNVLTIMISDACRAGKLAGSEIGGSQITSANLAQQLGNEIKIMSCQSNEYSLEGEQWGGGRGLFSYHLINGLMGLADNNGDKKITLLELRQYLENKVPIEAAPQSQIPMIVGSLGAQIATVDDEILEKVKNQKAEEVLALGAIDTKGFDEVVLGKAGSVTRLQYTAFVEAVDEKNLLGADGLSAYELYEELVKDTAITPLHNIMRRNLAAALQDEAQQTLNAFLGGNNKITVDFYEYPEKYAHFPQYLEKAADLLGEDHYMYNNLKAKQLYFEVQLKAAPFLFSASADSMRIRNMLLRQENIKKLEAALQLEEGSAYIHYLMGVMHSWSDKKDLVFQAYLNRAMELSPKFLQPLMTFGTWEREARNYDKALAYYKNALALDPDHMAANVNIGRISDNVFGEYDKALYYYNKALKQSPDMLIILYMLGNTYFNLRDFANADNYYKKPLGVKPDYRLSHLGLGKTYGYYRNFSKAFEHLNKAIELVPEDYQAPLLSGNFYAAMGEMNQAELHLQKALELNPGIETKAYLAAFYLQNNQAEKAKSMLNEVIQSNSSNNVNMVKVYSELAKIYWLESDPAAAYQQLDQALNYKVASNRRGNPWFYAEAQSIKATFLMQEDKLEEAAQAIDVAFETYSHSEEAAYAKAKWHIRKKQWTPGLQWLEKAFRKGYHKIAVLEADPDFDKVRKNYIYKKLIDTYVSK